MWSERRDFEGSKVVQGIEGPGHVLYLHIGLHKTGTTTLQKCIFPRLSQVSYFYKGAAAASAAVIRAFDGSPTIWRDQGIDLISSLISATSQRAVLISSEAMSTHKIFAPPAWRGNQRDPFLLAAHLAECSRRAAQLGYRVGVIVGIRRQDQYLASRYATHGGLADRPGQLDFERQVSEIFPSVIIMTEFGSTLRCYMI